MRIAVISDIHGNRTAFEAVLADLRQTSPDLILHGGDLAQGGSSPVEIIDHIRVLGWPGVVGNADEALFSPDALEEFANGSRAPAALWNAVREMMAATRELLGKERLEWLSALPGEHVVGSMALVHASPGDCWRAPAQTALDSELESIYSPLGRAVAVYGHIHFPYVRNLAAMKVVNSGSAGLPYDGDRRASYLLLDDSEPTIRRVEYDLEKEIDALAICKLPHSGWVAKMLETASPRMP